MASVTREERDGGGDEVMVEIDGEDFLLSDEPFPSLPEFPCLPSPAASPSPSSTSNYAKSSSSASSWSFLKVPGGADDMQQVPVVPDIVTDVGPPPPQDADPTAKEKSQEEFQDILSNLDILNPSLFADDQTEALPETDQSSSHVSAVGENCSDDLATVFLNWLKDNKDCISPEDLRRIKLKKSTVECAAHRLGGGNQGMTQLLKLILDWVQNHHLQRRQHHGGDVAEQDLQEDVIPEFSIKANTNLEYKNNYESDNNIMLCNSSWIPQSSSCTLDSAAAGSSLMMTYPIDPSSAPAFSFDGAAGGVTVTTQPFSATDELQPMDSGSSWPHFSSPAAQFAAYARPQQYAGGYPVQYPGQLVDHRLAKIASATREARKKRMARQRRLSSLHQHRNQKQHRVDESRFISQSQQQQQQHFCCSRDGEGVNYSQQSGSRNCAFWSSMASLPSQQMHSLLESSNPSLDPRNIEPPSPRSSTIPHSIQQYSNPSERRQGWKVEKNLKFLLQKVLKQSDVGSLGRIVLPKKEAEIHLPELTARDGISIPMEDIGTSRVWNMRYRFWPNNKSRMYLLENTGDFVRCNALQEGDFIVIYSDVNRGKFMIRGVKVRQPTELKAIGSKNARQKQIGAENRSLQKSKNTDKSSRNLDSKMKKLPSAAKTDTNYEQRN